MEQLLQIPNWGWFLSGLFIGTFLGIFLIGLLSAGARADLEFEISLLKQALWEKEQDLKKLEGK